jgi:23S rRNA (cytidine2498-2'-O)-methyltransferase
VRVTAVDNGPMKGSVAVDPLVTHLREDGLTWRPKRPVDWLVCDIVLQPIRIAELVARWLADGDARRAIFNLKLPMKKRYDEVKRCEQRMREVTKRAGVNVDLRIRQLYHDREEVTGYVARRD